MRLSLFAVIAFIFFGCSSSSPTLSPVGCDALVLDLTSGLLNGVAPTATRAQINTQFPCATGETADGEVYNFGGGVFFLDHDFYIYTHRDFTEVRTDFAGEVVPAVLGATSQDLDEAFGTPVRVEDGARFYERDYGCLRAEFGRDSERVDELGVHAKACVNVILPR